MMKTVLFLALIGCASVLADNYLCPKKDGDLFECFESDIHRRTCLTEHHGPTNMWRSYVVCSTCKRKWEFCVTGGDAVQSKHPESHCGADYQSTPCTPSNSEWSSVFYKRVHIQPIEPKIHY